MVNDSFLVRWEFPVTWAIVYASTIFALAYVVPKIMMLQFQAAVINSQVASLTETENASEVQMEFPGNYT